MVCSVDDFMRRMLRFCRNLLAFLSGVGHMFASLWHCSFWPRGHIVILALSGNVMWSHYHHFCALFCGNVTRSHDYDVDTVELCHVVSFLSRGVLPFPCVHWIHCPSLPQENDSMDFPKIYDMTIFSCQRKLNRLYPSSDSKPPNMQSFFPPSNLHTG